MKPEDMAAEAVAAINAGTRMSMVFRKGQKRPPGFPRGELLCENYDGRHVYSFDPMRVLAWLTANGLIEAKLAAPSPSVNEQPVAPVDRRKA